jgi:transglutaminase-like putative cysteine protease
MTVGTAPSVVGPVVRDPWRPAPPLLAVAAGWIALYAWSGMVAEPMTFLVPTGMLAVVMALVGSGLRTIRVPAYVVAMVQALVGLLGLNLLFAASESLLGLIPTQDSLRQLFYVIGNGAETLNAYTAPVAVNPTHTRAFLMVCGLGVLFSIDVLAFGLRRPPLAALPLLVTLSVPVSILNDALALPVFVGTALLFLRLLATEHVEKLWSWGDSRSRGPRPRLAVLWQASVAAVLIALVIAPLVPVTDLLKRHQGAGSGVGGNGSFQLTTVNPFIRLRRDLVEQTHTPMVYAETKARDTGYLRTTVLDQFRGDEWRPSARDLPSDNSADGPFPTPQGLGPGVVTSLTDWKLELAPGFGTTWLPLPYPLSELKVRGSWRFDDRTLDVAYVGGSTPSSLSYSATAMTLGITAGLLQNATPPPTPLRLRMTDVPSELPQVVRDKAKELTRGAKTDYEKALALQDWFRRSGGFTYSLDQRSGSGMQLLADFVTNDRVGYCEQFAAAMATMGRVLNIPSRVVVGFLNGTEQPDGRILYTSDDRHAWPEMYFSGVGWVRFEPTPSTRAGATPAWTRQDANAATPSTAPSAGAVPSQAPDPNRATPDSQSGDGGFPIPWWPVVALGGIVLVGVGPGVVRRAQRRRRLGAGDPVHLAEGAWAELRATALDLGLGWPDQRSPREQARSVTGQVRAEDQALASLEDLLVRVERSRYGRSAGSARGVVTVDPQLRTDTLETVESWRKVMLGSVDRERGWRGRVWPVSLVRRRDQRP